MMLDVAWCREALQECWNHQWTPKECAEYIGISTSQTYKVLMGQEWTQVPRPEGWVYPFPQVRKQKVQSRSLQREKQAHYLAEYVRRRMTLQHFSVMVGISRYTAWLALSGKTWRSVERPEGFQYPWPEASAGERS